MNIYRLERGLGFRQRAELADAKDVKNPRWKYVRSMAPWAIVLAVATMVSCASEELLPNEPLPEPPGLTRVAHPAGYDVADVRAIFYDQGSPKREEMKACSETFEKLRERAGSKDELKQGSIELVQAEPVFYHWCFYSKLLEVHDFVRNPETYLDQRREKVVGVYTFLSSIARGFLAEFNDSRYMRWSIEQYQALSLRVFYRRLELTETGEVDLLSRFYPKPYGRLEGEADGQYRVLDKYGLLPKRGRNTGKEEEAAPGEILKLGNQGGASSAKVEEIIPMATQAPTPPIQSASGVSIQVEEGPARIVPPSPVGESSISESIGRLPARIPANPVEPVAEKIVSNDLDEEPAGLDDLDRIEPVPVTEDEDNTDFGNSF